MLDRQPVHAHEAAPPCGTAASCRPDRQEMLATVPPVVKLTVRVTFVPELDLAQ